MADRKIYEEEGQAHYLTFSCYRRRKLLNDDIHKKIVIGVLSSQLTLQEGECFGFVVMPDHVHAIVCFPIINRISHFMKQWKQMSSRQIKNNMKMHYTSYTSDFDVNDPAWQRRYYDFNLYTEKKLVEKLKYMHENPVRGGLVDRPEDWQFSSAPFYLSGQSCGVKIQPPE
ncbi:MAG: transposase [Deltaproteobacteria bacterium]|nr:transposase [Deltaproteobacteria bacterium]